MRTGVKTAIAALVATLALSIALTATASARNWSVSEKEFEIQFPILLLRTSTNTISCPITILGRYVERTLPKIVGTRLGVIRHISVRLTPEPPCTGGTLTVLESTLPWNINYQGFTGRLPSIEAIRESLIGIAFRIRTSSGIGCLFGTTAAEPAFGEVLVRTGRVEGLRADETTTIRLGGGFLCSLVGTASFSGTGTVRDLPGLNAITVTLI